EQGQAGKQRPCGWIPQTVHDFHGTRSFRDSLWLIRGKHSPAIASKSTIGSVLANFPHGLAKAKTPLAIGPAGPMRKPPRISERDCLAWWGLRVLVQCRRAWARARPR